MLCLSNAVSLGGSKLPSDIGLLSADMTAFPPWPWCKVDSSVTRGPGRWSRHFSIVAATAAQWPAHQLCVSVCVCLDSAVALSVESLTAAGGDPTRSFLGSVAGLELVGDLSSWKLEA